MGSNQAPDTKPVHTVHMSSFDMLSTEVTNLDYESFDPHHVRGEYSPRDLDPVANVTLSEVEKYLKWLSKDSAFTYALPTEAQWEYAARGGLEHADFPWGPGSPDGRALIGSIRTMLVGSFDPNGYGLYDMCGNMGEMVFEQPYSYSGAEVTDPIGKPAQDFYVVRGAGPSEYMPWVWFRSVGVSSMATPFTGFRLVRKSAR